MIVGSPWMLTMLFRFTSPLGFLVQSRRPRICIDSNKPAILFVDSSIPQSDRDAGAVTMVQFMRLFVDHGWAVYLCPLAQTAHDASHSKLIQSGIHVISPGRYSLFTWLGRNAQYFQVIFLSRPPVAALLLPILKPIHAITAYYGHDLHGERFRLEALHSGHWELNWISRRYLAVERSISQRVDVSYYPSADEVRQMRALEPEANIKELPAYSYDFEHMPPIRLISGRRFLFVGNYRHQPNLDAVTWLINEIWPRIRGEIAGAELQIVGANPPADLVHATRLQQDIHWNGWLSDQELDQLYQSSRVVLVPLRYGAGVKHKVVSAIAQGCAVVSTDTGLQGLPELQKLVGLAMTPEDFAKASLGLILDDKLWLSRVAAARKALAVRFSSQSMWQALDDLHHFS
jgi:glycosyltransferase involved in cell wall biosynthesis